MYSTCIAERRLGLLHFDGHRMAPPHSDAFDFFMAETTCSDVQSDLEDANLDLVLQQFKSPSCQEPQHCLSDICGASDTAEGFDLLCDQSSSQLTIEDNISRSRVTSASDELVTESCSSPQKGKNSKGSVGTSAKPHRQTIPNYQTMTPWTNENLTTQESFPSANQEIRCFTLDAQILRDQDLNSKSIAPSSSKPPASRPGAPAVTETVYSLKYSLPKVSVPGNACGQTATKRHQNQVGEIPHMTREKRFRKTAEALQKCGLWDIAMKTGNLIKRNAELQKEIERFRAEATMFLEAVVQNPENKELMESWTTGVPLTLGNRAFMTDGFESDTATTAAHSTESKVSDSNSSTSSGYASYTEGGSRQTCPA